MVVIFFFLGFVSTHSRPKAAGTGYPCRPVSAGVSTHSRPKAAVKLNVNGIYLFEGFNTQPPEGGWIDDFGMVLEDRVSTHSRPKAAEPSEPMTAPNC